MAWVLFCNGRAKAMGGQINTCKSLISLYLWGFDAGMRSGVKLLGTPLC
jgi:hypothetical protein